MLLDRDHLPLHLGQFRRRLLVATYKERSWPENDTAAAVVQPSFAC